MLAIRVLVVFFIVPVTHYSWRRKGPFDSSWNPIKKAVETFDAYDGSQFRNVMEQRGYIWEINHAFYPLFPYFVRTLADLTGIESAVIGQVYQFVIEWSTGVLIYILTKRLLLKENVAYTAALLWTFNHSLAYHLTIQTETTFTFLSVLAMTVMYWKIDHTNIAGSLKSKNIIGAAYVFGVNALCRAQGLLFLGFQGMIFVKKIFENRDRFFKIFKYVFYSLCLILIYVLPYGTVTYWKPYVMHCEPKIDRTDAVSAWCEEKLPNIFTYIQFVYWDNRLFGFLYRKMSNLHISWLMNIIVIYVITKFFKGLGWNLTTFGLFGLGESKITRD